MWHQLRAKVTGDIARTFLHGDVLLPFCASLILVLAGISFSLEFVRRPAARQAAEDASPRPQLVSAMLSWDASRYRAIAAEGYRADDIKRAASFPGYPFLARAVSAVLSCPQDVGLLITSNLAFLVACAFLYRYVLVSRVSASPGKLARLTVALACFSPLAIFFHVGFSESLFLALVVIAFYGMERGWPAPAIGLVIGLATGTRLVGLALVLPFLDHLRTSGSWRDRLLSSAAGVCLSCWGLIGFMAIQDGVYGDPLTFVKAQRQFVTENDLPAQEVALRLVTLQPIWSVFNPVSKSYWESADSSQNVVFNIRWLNPLVFCTFCAIVGIAWWKGVIRRGEALYSLIALGLPYVTHSIQGGMLSQGRYALVVFPVYIAVATVCRSLPGSMLMSMACLGAALLFAFAALFAASYAVY